MTLDIEAIKARADKATAGPWRVIIDDDGNPLSGRPSVEASEELDCGIVHWDGFVQEYWRSARGDKEIQANASFIAHARTDIPTLIAALEASEAARVKAEQERDALKEALKPFDDFAQYLESETEGFMDDEAISCEYRGDIATAEFPDLKFGHFRADRRALEAVTITAKEE